MELVGYHHQKRLRVLHFLKNNGAFFALILLFIINAILTPNFFAIQTFYINITQVAPIAIVAIGMCLVIASGGGGIDISVG